MVGCRSSCNIVQRITNAFKFILQACKVDCVSYLDDLGSVEVPVLALEAFDKMGQLLKEFNVEESVNKACGPLTRMIFLGIIVDALRMTLELDECRLSELNSILIGWENKTHANLREIQSLVGILSFASTCMRQGRSFFFQGY